jgi:hypothetical protein
MEIGCETFLESQSGNLNYPQDALDKQAGFRTITLEYSFMAGLNSQQAAATDSQEND